MQNQLLDPFYIEILRAPIFLGFRLKIISFTLI